MHHNRAIENGNRTILDSSGRLRLGVPSRKRQNPSRRLSNRGVIPGLELFEIGIIHPTAGVEVGKIGVGSRIARGRRLHSCGRHLAIGVCQRGEAIRCRGSASADYRPCIVMSLCENRSCQSCASGRVGPRCRQMSQNVPRGEDFCRRSAAIPGKNSGQARGMSRDRVLIIP